MLSFSRKQSVIPRACDGLRLRLDSPAHLATPSLAAPDTTDRPRRDMASQEPGDEERSLRECEAYVQRHNIQQLLRDCIVQVRDAVTRHDSPLTILSPLCERRP